jgi:hypothetical protein
VVAEFDMGSLHRRPSRAMSDLVLPFVSRMGGKGMIKCLAINVLRVRRQMGGTGEGRSEFVRYGMAPALARQECGPG